MASSSSASLDVATLQANRSVNDFHSVEDLQKALTTMDMTRSKRVSIHNYHQAPLDNNATTNLISPETLTLNNELDWVLEKTDKENTESQSIQEELQRLLCLKSYLVLDSDRKEKFDRMTNLASRMFQCPISLITLVDLGRQWFLSNLGLDFRETKRKYAFCAHAIMGKEDLVIVKDATSDVRFKDNPLVTGPPHVRFYAAAALVSPEGYKLGTLCVFDTKPRPEGMTMEEKQNMLELSGLTVQALVGHKKSSLRKHSNTSCPKKWIAYTAHDLLMPLTGAQSSLANLMRDYDYFGRRLTASQREQIATTSNCTNVMRMICRTAIDSFWKMQMAKEAPSSHKTKPSHIIKVSNFVKSLYMVLDPFPKKVPLIITVHPSIPEILYFEDELKVFRSCVNFLTNACEHTETGSIQFSVRKHGNMILFECKDTGSGVSLESYPYLFQPHPVMVEDSHSELYSCLKPSKDGKGVQQDIVCTLKMPKAGLGLYSVAVQVASMGGSFGYQPLSESAVSPTITQTEVQKSGSIFWFQIPFLQDKQQQHLGKQDVGKEEILPIIQRLEAEVRGKGFEMVTEETKEEGKPAKRSVQGKNERSQPSGSQSSSSFRASCLNGRSVSGEKLLSMMRSNKEKRTKSA